MTMLGDELPAGSVFAGERELAYIEDFAHVVRVAPPQPVCTLVPPPPRYRLGARHECFRAGVGVVRCTER